jgi:hypothetical protein
LLVAGSRGAGKDISQDIYEAQLSLERYSEMRAEEYVVPTIKGTKGVITNDISS